MANKQDWHALDEEIPAINDNQIKNYNDTIKHCCAIIREAIKKEKDHFARMAVIFDRIVAEDTTTKIEDVQQRQYDTKKMYWSYSEDYVQRLKKLLNILNKEIIK